MKESKFTKIKKPTTPQEAPKEQERQNPFEGDTEVTPHDVPEYDPSKQDEQ